MKPGKQTVVFGIRLGVDPKILLGILGVFLAVLILYDLGGDGGASKASGGVRAQIATRASGAARQRIIPQRRSSTSSLREGLKLTAVDISRAADMDPTLHYDLLDRLQATPESHGIRNLFQVAATRTAVVSSAEEIHGPTIIPAPLPVDTISASLPPPPPPPIPLKYCGFIKAAGSDKGDRGFFLDGDNVLVGVEGQVLDHRYLIVSLTVTAAKLEDVNQQSGQTLLLTKAEVAGERHP
jgi:hypothetical protein